MKTIHLWVSAASLLSLTLACTAPRSSDRSPSSLSGSFKIEDARVLPHNTDAWLEKRIRIKSAKKSVSLAYYIIEGDTSSALLFRDLIAQKAKNPDLEVKILVDYWQSQHQLPFIKFLDKVPGFEVKRYGAPDQELMGALDQIGIDKNLFLSSVMMGDKDGLLTSLKNATELNLVSALKEQVKDWKADPKSTHTNPLSLSGRILAAQVKAPTAVEFFHGMRMFMHWSHFKLTLVDGRCFVMGGRNLSDQYHLNRGDELVKDRPYVFNDVDVSGCIQGGAGEQTASFSGLWNSPRNVRVSERLFEKTPSVAMTQAEFDAQVAKGAKLEDLPQSSDVINMPDGAISAVVADNQPPVTEESSNILRKYVASIDAMKAGEELTFVNAYFYIDDSWPIYMDHGKPGAVSLSSLFSAIESAAKRGVKVRIHTNSDKSTDLSLVNMQAFRGYRRLVEAGVELYELGPNQGSLHMKAAVFGDHGMAVGSFNLDPRSHLFDTNNALFFGAESATMGPASEAYLKQVHALNWTRVDEARLKAIDAILQEPGKGKFLRGVRTIRETL